jgi:hypothetical protein
MKTISSVVTKMVTISLLVFFFAACSKEGPAGPAGEQGEQGPAGQQGPKGDMGNANVKVYTKDISTATWTIVGTSANGYLNLVINAPTVLTSDVVNDWVNLVYVYTSEFQEPWSLLPFTSDRGVSVNSSLTVGKLTLRRSQNGQPSTQSWYHTVRLVCIEPSATGTLARKAAPLPDFNDYRAVCKYYGIEE